jgi:xanthine dehydrogenase YagT iron-sulfur-binding subunit
MARAKRAASEASTMTDSNNQASRRPSTRAIVEKALQAEQLGDDDQANALIERATQIDPDEAVAVLQEQSAPPLAPVHAGMTFAIVLTINGHRRELMVDARTTLLDALRDRLHLTGTKRGCDLGQCGACTVLLDGRAVNACMMFAAMVEDHDVVTIEGLSANGKLHPVQQAFIDCDAFQCGYCTPGQIMNAIGLIREGKASSAEEIREGMSGNICRCGAYPGIVEAVLTAMAEAPE